MAKPVGRRRKPVRSTDKHNTPIVLVPLANHSEPAIVDVSTFDRLMAEGFSDQWTFNQFINGYRRYGFVRCTNNKVHGRLSTIARLVTDASPGQVVKYRDRNPLNLRRYNLTLKNGNAKGATACP